MSQSPSPSSPGSTPPQQGSAKLVVVALVAGLAAVILVNIYVEIARTQAAGGSMIIYRTTRSLDPGDTLDEKDVKAEEISDRFAESHSNAVKRDATVKP